MDEALCSATANGYGKCYTQKDCGPTLAGRQLTIGNILPTHLVHYTSSLNDLQQVRNDTIHLVNYFKKCILITSSMHC